MGGIGALKRHGSALQSALWCRELHVGPFLRAWEDTEVFSFLPDFQKSCVPDPPAALHPLGAQMDTVSKLLVSKGAVSRHRPQKTALPQGWVETCRPGGLSYTRRVWDIGAIGYAGFGIER